MIATLGHSAADWRTTSNASVGVRGLPTTINVPPALAARSASLPAASLRAAKSSCHIGAVPPSDSSRCGRGRASSQACSSAVGSGGARNWFIASGRVMTLSAGGTGYCGVVMTRSNRPVGGTRMAQADEAGTPATVMSDPARDRDCALANADDHVGPGWRKPAPAGPLEMSDARPENLPIHLAHPSVVHGAGLERPAQSFRECKQLIVVAAAITHQNPDAGGAVHVVRTRRYSRSSWKTSAPTLVTVPRTIAIAAPITPHLQDSGAIERKNTALPSSLALSGPADWPSA